MIIDCISDLHGHYPKLEGGDILIVAGDLTARDRADEYVDKFQPWMDSQDYKYKIVISGNHDNLLQKGIPVFTQLTEKGEPCSSNILLPIFNCKYLCDSGTEFQGLKIWGSPWTKTFEGMNPMCKAFTVDTDGELAEKWALIPSDVGVLITHSPAYGIMDECVKGENVENVGSKSLYDLLYSERIRPKLHVFGHIHEAYGHIPKMLDFPGTQFVNASHVNERYQPINKPIRIEI